MRIRVEYRDELRVEGCFDSDYDAGYNTLAGLRTPLLIVPYADCNKFHEKVADQQ